MVWAKVQWCLHLVDSDLVDCIDLADYFWWLTKDRNGQFTSLEWIYLVDWFYLMDCRILVYICVVNRDITVLILLWKKYLLLVEVARSETPGPPLLSSFEEQSHTEKRDMFCRNMQSFIAKYIQKFASERNLRKFLKFRWNILIQNKKPKIKIHATKGQHF